MMANGTYHPPRPLGEALRSSPGWSVYECIAEDGTALYVGMTSRGSGRLAEHVGKPWWPAVDMIQLRHHTHREDAAVDEAETIRQLRPLFNVTGRPTGRPLRLESCEDLYVRIAGPLEAEVAELKAALTAARAIAAADGDSIGAAKKAKRG